MLGGLREEGPSLNTVFADYLTHADLTKYAVINPNSRKISISSANFAALNKKKNAEDNGVIGDALLSGIANDTRSSSNNT